MFNVLAIFFTLWCDKMNLLLTAIALAGMVIICFHGDSIILLLLGFFQSLVAIQLLDFK